VKLKKLSKFELFPETRKHELDGIASNHR